MAFGLTRFKQSPAGIATNAALDLKLTEVLAAAREGTPPVLVIAPMLEDHLGDRQTNSNVGRLIRERLGPHFQQRGRRQWSRKHGTESGTYYAYIG